MLTRHPDRANGVPSHVLVVDDDMAIRRYVSTVLERRQYRVSVAADAEAAMELIASDRPDLVILDEHLPDMNGEVLLRHWRASGSRNDFPVIFFSSTPDPTHFRTVMEMGADDYLTKPVKPAELTDAVAVQLNKFQRRRAAHAAQVNASPSASAAAQSGAAQGSAHDGTQAGMPAHARGNAPARRPRPAGVPDGYEIMGTLAKGGSAIAYRARREEDGADCVIKVIELSDDLEPDLVARFSREGRVLERSRHPGVVRVFAHGVIEVRPDGTHGKPAVSAVIPTASPAVSRAVSPTLSPAVNPSVNPTVNPAASPNGQPVDETGTSSQTRSYAYLALEYLAGGTLRAMLGRPWEPREALRLLAQVADGLGAVHGAGVIHRDIKPDNILLRPNSLTPVLVDFGTAKDLQDAQQQTTKGVLLGTPSYMAPELITGGSPTPATDLYACGAVLYELLTGSKPYTAETLGDLFHRHLEFPVPRLPSKLAAAQPLLNRLLAKRPEDRLRDGRVLAKLLREYLPAAVSSPSQANYASA